jgi:hypothetical protein
LFYIQQNAGRIFLNKRRSIGKSVRSLNNLIMRRFDRDRPDREVLERITGTNRWVIGYLVEQERAGREVCQRDLEEAFGITRSTVSKVLDLMERKGSDPADKRVAGCAAEKTDAFAEGVGAFQADARVRGGR